MKFTIRKNKEAPSGYERGVEAGVKLAKIIQDGIDADDISDSRLERR